MELATLWYWIFGLWTIIRLNPSCSPNDSWSMVVRDFVTWKFESHLQKFCIVSVSNDILRCRDVMETIGFLSFPFQAATNCLSFWWTPGANAFAGRGEALQDQFFSSAQRYQGLSPSFPWPSQEIGETSNCGSSLGVVWGACVFGTWRYGLGWSRAWTLRASGPKLQFPQFKCLDWKIKQWQIQSLNSWFYLKGSIHFHPYGGKQKHSEWVETNMFGSDTCRCGHGSQPFSPASLALIRVLAEGALRFVGSSIAVGAWSTGLWLELYRAHRKRWKGALCWEGLLIADCWGKWDQVKTGVHRCYCIRYYTILYTIHKGFGDLKSSLKSSLDGFFPSP